MKGKITTRDVLFFFIGFMTLFLFLVVYDWDSHVQAFKEGAAAAADKPQTENKE